MPSTVWRALAWALGGRLRQISVLDLDQPAELVPTGVAGLARSGALGVVQCGVSDGRNHAELLVPPHNRRGPRFRHPRRAVQFLGMLLKAPAHVGIDVVRVLRNPRHALRGRGHRVCHDGELLCAVARAIGKTGSAQLEKRISRACRC